MEALPQVIVSGLLIGAVYALIAVGLTLIYGVMDVVNFAHGTFLMLSMFTAYWLHELLHFDPIISLPVCVAVIFALSWVSYKVIVKRVLDAPPVMQIFATFGLMVFLENLALVLWKPDYRIIQDSFVTGNFAVADVNISAPKLAAAIGSLLMTAFVVWFMAKTKTGRSLKATAINRNAAKLMGINTDRMFGIAWGVGGACLGVAGALLATFYYIFPGVGSIFNLLAFVTVGLGGFGSISGAFVAGLLIGVIENVAGFLIDPAFKYAIVFIIFILVILFRPQGLMGRK